MYRRLFETLFFFFYQTNAVDTGFSWFSIFPSLIGTLFGGLITIGALWTKETFERRNAIQEWFQKTYIDGGIDPLVSYLELIRAHLITRDPSVLKGLDAKIAFPVEAYSRFAIVTGDKSISAVALVLSRYLHQTPEEMEVHLEDEQELIISLLDAAITNILKLHERLLDVRLQKKSDVHGVRQNEKIVEVVNNMKNDAANIETKRKAKLKLAGETR